MVLFFIIIVTCCCCIACCKADDALEKAKAHKAKEDEAKASMMEGDEMAMDGEKME